MQQHNAFNPAAEEWTSGKSASHKEEQRTQVVRNALKTVFGVDGM
jgi:hypothetical protein